MYTFQDKRLVMLKLSEITASPDQPRKSFDEYELKRLSDSIKASGIIQPLIVRKSENGYRLIAGERRLKAAVMAGLRRVPCVVHKADDETAALYSLIENLQRSSLTVFEEAEGINRLIYEYGISQSEAAARLGISQSSLSNKLRLLKLSDSIKERISSAGLTERHARALLRLSEEDREEALDRIIAQGLTVSQTEEYIFSVINPQEKPKPVTPDEPVRKSAIGDVRLFSNSLSKLISTLQSSGIDAKSRKYENDKYIEFKVRIQKNSDSDRYKQLKIC